MNNRIAHIQKYANDRGFALAILQKDRIIGGDGNWTTGFMDCTPRGQTLRLDRAIATIDEYSNDRVYLNRQMDAQHILPFDL